MPPPLFSTFSLITELIVSASIFYVFYSGYKHNHFPFKLALFALSYEILFNISYMVSRSLEHVPEYKEEVHSGFEIALAAFHGILSLVMFIALIVFLIIAFKKYKAGINYFKEHNTLTIMFLVLWSLSVISGIVFYFTLYTIF